MAPQGGAVYKPPAVSWSLALQAVCKPPLLGLLITLLAALRVNPLTRDEGLLHCQIR
jgi:hypothetical protein